MNWAVFILFAAVGAAALCLLICRVRPDEVLQRAGVKLGWRRRGSACIRIVPDQHRTIQEALNEALTGDRIIVRPGVYRGTIDFAGKDVLLSSEDPQDPEVVRATVLTSAGAGTVVFFASGESELARLEGFTITGGGGVLVRRWSVLGASAWAGGGIFIGQDSSPTIRHNLIEGNRADLGGGIYVSSSSLSLIEHNLVRSNRAVLGGGMRAAGDFLRQSEDAGRWRTRDGREILLVRSCQIISNSAHIGGGMSVSRGAVAEIRGCFFAQNTARWDGGGVAIWDSAAPKISSSWFLENTCGSDYGFGGGVSIINNCRPRLEDNRFRANRAYGACESGGGAVAVNRSQPVLVRNSAWGNSASVGAEVYAWAGSNVTLEENEIDSHGIVCRAPEQH